MRNKVGALSLKERSSFTYVDKGELCVIDNACVVRDVNGVRTAIPVGGLGAILLGPGASASHAAIKMAGDAGTMIHWVGEQGVRFYSSMIPPHASARNTLWQARLALDSEARTKVARAMFKFRFPEEGDNFVDTATIKQLMGFEGDRVYNLYRQLAKTFRVVWTGRRYDKRDFDMSDVPNKCLSAANVCLYGLCEAAIILGGFSPAFGFVHCGTQKSFVYDIADLYKFTISAQAAFTIAAKQNVQDPEGETRRLCRDIFARQQILKKIIPTIQTILKAGELPAPEFPDDAIILEPEMPCIEEEENASCLW